MCGGGSSLNWKIWLKFHKNLWCDFSSNTFFWRRLIGNGIQFIVHWCNTFFANSVTQASQQNIQCTFLFKLNQLSVKRFKTESTSKLSNFSFQWAKTLYQNNVKHIAFFSHFLRLMTQLFICNKTKKTFNGSARKWMSNFTKLHLTQEIFKVLPVFSQFLWNLILIFSGSHQKFSLALLQITN